jgi:hypothetical protein
VDICDTAALELAQNSAAVMHSKVRRPDAQWYMAFPPLDAI